MIKFFKNEGTETGIKSKVNHYKEWFDGTFLGPEPQVEDKIKEASKNGFEWLSKTEEEIKKEASDIKEQEIIDSYINDNEKWLNEVVRPQRDHKIVEHSWILERHSREKELSIGVSLTSQQVIEYLNYQQSLADFTRDLTYSGTIQWPPKPYFIQ